MDFKTIRDQISTNIDHFTLEERKVIILKLLDFLKSLDDQNEHQKEEIVNLTNEMKQLTDEIDELKANQIDQDSYKEKVEEIIDLANQEAEKIVETAGIEAEVITQQADTQSKEYIYDLLVRMENLVKELRSIDDEAKAYRYHILTIFKKTIFKFADSDYHILKINDSDLKKLMSFYREDDALQKFSDQIMLKLQKFENYLSLYGTKIKNQEYDNQNINTLEDILSNPNLVLESFEEELEALEDNQELEEEVISEPKIDTEVTKQPIEQEVIKEQEEPKIKQEPFKIEIPVKKEELKVENDKPQEKSNPKFLDIINRYNQN